MSDSFQQQPLVYAFGHGRADGTSAMKDILGGKGAGLAEMTNLGIAVPPGFTIAATLCHTYLETRSFPSRLRREVEAALQRVEAETGKEFGGEEHPLLVSVRSGAAVSMPGMMDTILNLGMNDVTVEGLARRSGNPSFAWDCYRRFVAMYSAVVLDLPKAPFDELADAALLAHGAASPIELPAAALKALVARFKSHATEATGTPFPDDPMEQLWGAIAAVFESWNTRRAIDYRRMHEIPDSLGTAVNIVAMVYGNLGETSGTGVAFTRNPATGARELYGEFLPNAQGEDVVSGARTPEPIANLKDHLPGAYHELDRMARTLERHFRDVQDMEFTIEDGTLYMLQTRRAQRTGQAAFRVACEMVAEKLISEEEAVARIPPQALEQLLHPMIDPGASLDLIASGLPASPGAASGAVVFDADVAEQRARSGESVILVRRETSPEDFHGMVAARAILTARGGMTSHAAVVARGMGKPCIVGASLDVDEAQQQIRVGDRSVAEGEWITLDGTSGKIYLGQAKLLVPEMDEHYHQLMGWADRIRPMRVRVNADTPADAHRGRDFGAEGIGLCRTEHMFFEGDRLTAVREMILATRDEERQRALERLLPMQRGDFEAIFRAMEGFPVTIRLLDPPLHEFLPKDAEEIEALAAELGRDAGKIRDVVAGLHEQNPMLGLRGCRLGIIHPEITRMQARAIFEAACTVAARKGRVQPEVMLPLVASVTEFRRQALVVREVAEEVFRERQLTVPYLLGTMIELPRAALTADEIAREAQFFSFGTNDLTQTTWGLSRDDSSRFLPHYLETGIIDQDPFQSLDVAGVGRLVRMAAEAGRATRADLKLGICGEHGGDPASIDFCESVRMNYVSCSPYRVPIARLAAAQAALANRGTVIRTRATV
ncbi:MAG TPA: pyruvate, phosphate dikinase [Gemmatimonadales bacterium]|nr:pyruvate, phosphate dikinase [Gemmatimonadales bacterium]HRX18790.1 pyruvate, phosphate dikinase [Gemmatimonadales bacterium]